MSPCPCSCNPLCGCECHAAEREDLAAVKLVLGLMTVEHEQCHRAAEEYRDVLAVERGRSERLQDAAMWAVKNFQEWNDTETWGGEAFEHLSASMDTLHRALQEASDE